jgi:hypothetical protein
MLQQVVEFLAGKGNFPQWLYTLRIKGHSVSKIKWVVFDLSEGTPLCEEVFWFFISSFSSNEYVFLDGVQIAT